MHGKVTGLVHNGKGLFEGLPETFQVTRYHSLVIDRHTLPGCMEADAWSKDGEIMGMHHRNMPVYSVQFHPEASPGPEDSGYLFDVFMELMGGKENAEKSGD